VADRVNGLSLVSDLDMRFLSYLFCVFQVRNTNCWDRRPSQARSKLS